MTETEKKSVPKKGIVVALGKCVSELSCIAHNTLFTKK